MTFPQYVWAEKYRPKALKECILPKQLESTFESCISSSDKSFPNMLFYCGPGTGKTSVARALCREADHEFILVNGSKDSGIDTLRTTIQDFASSVSLSSHRKCVIIDEADYLNPVSTQPALRGFMEEFSSNCA